MALPRLRQHSRRDHAELANSSPEEACGTLSEGQRPAARSDSGAPLPLARLDSHMREERAGQVDVEKGLQPRQLRDGGLLREAQEQINSAWVQLSSQALVSSGGLPVGRLRNRNTLIGVHVLCHVDQVLFETAGLDF